MHPKSTLLTSLYPHGPLADALSSISSQGLWLLLSIDQYGWRADHDLARRILQMDDDAATGPRAHAQLAAFAHVFHAVDRLWRLVKAIRFNIEGGEFLSEEEGYLCFGNNLVAELEELKNITFGEWRTILAIPDEATIRILSPSDTAESNISSAALVPQLAIDMMSKLHADLSHRDETLRGDEPRTFSRRDLDNRGRHGSPVIYLDCSPTSTSWVAVEDYDSKEVDLTRRFGVLMRPPNDDGHAYIGLVPIDWGPHLVAISAALADWTRRFARSHLARLTNRELFPLAPFEPHHIPD